MGQIWTPKVGYIHVKGHVNNITQVVYVEKLDSPYLSGDLDKLKAELYIWESKSS